MAIVTGAGRGIGAGCARGLVEDGWRDLLLCDISAELLEDTARQLHNAGARIDTFVGDITDPAFVPGMIAACGGRPVAAAVHAAGVSPSMAGIERILEINLDAPIAFVEGIADHMAPASAAVLIASNSTLYPCPADLAALFEGPIPEGGAVTWAERVPTGNLAYQLAKRGVKALAKREAVRFGARGARIVTVSPGLTETIMTADKSHEGMQALIAAKALKRYGEVEEVADVVAFLVSDKARLMTGCDVLVDGGEIAGMGW